MIVPYLTILKYKDFKRRLRNMEVQRKRNFNVENATHIKWVVTSSCYRNLPNNQALKPSAYNTLTIIFETFYSLPILCASFIVAPYFKSGLKTTLTHYCDAIMGVMAFQITSLAIVYSTVYSDVDQRKHQRSASLAFVQGIHRWPVNSPHKWPVWRKMFPFDDVIMMRFHSSLRQGVFTTLDELFKRVFVVFHIRDMESFLSNMCCHPS